MKLLYQLGKQFGWSDRRSLIRTSESILSRICKAEPRVQWDEETTENKEFETAYNITFMEIWWCIETDL